jgi:flagella basal body P-ring formation protein FlgA
MASFSKSRNHRAAALGVLIVLTIGCRSARAQTASASAVATPSSSESPDRAELTRQIQVNLLRLVPAEIRVDSVALGCVPPAGATLKTVAPGITSLTSRSFMVELQSGDRSTFCSASMNASRQLVVATHDINLDAPVTQSDFAPAWIDAFGIAPGGLASFPAEGSYVSAMAIRAGQPLYPNSLKHPLAVHPGDLVTVLVKNGPVTVRAQLQSQSQAAVGETASMINPSSGMPVQVTVTGPKVAELVIQ